MSGSKQRAQLIYDVSLEELASLSECGRSFDLSESGPPCRYRLLHCNKFVDEGRLHIYEYSDFPHEPYSAISYPWRGNHVDANFHEKSFSVQCSEGDVDGDPISLNVLRDACKASLMHGADLLWLDRLGIIQTSKVDKDWQIQQMYQMYRLCTLCIIIPGGLRRLVPLDEETTWIHRGWTLQEAIAPTAAVVIFSWKTGSKEVRAGDNHGRIEEVVAGRSALATLSLIIDASTVGNMYIKDDMRMNRIKLFCAYDNDRVMAPNISALAIAMSPDFTQDEKEYAIWQSAMMRTSSRPVDMVFSIMGVFGVQLNPKDFPDKNNRLGANIALAQAILSKGGRANWLGVSFRADPCPYLSTFPIFPATRVVGKALLPVDGSYKEVSLFMQSEAINTHVFGSLPQGSMDSDGYLAFTARAIPVMEVTSSAHATITPDYITATDGSVWRTIDDSKSSLSPSPNHGAYAVLLGFFVGYYPGASPANDANNVRAMLIQTHQEGRYHVRSYFMLSLGLRTWAKTWSERSFSVGGPEPLSQSKVEDAGGVLVEADDLHPDAACSPDQAPQQPDLTVVNIRKSRWALPQVTYEQSVTPQI